MCVWRWKFSEPWGRRRFKKDCHSYSERISSMQRTRAKRSRSSVSLAIDTIYKRSRTSDGVAATKLLHFNVEFGKHWKRSWWKGCLFQFGKVAKMLKRLNLNPTTLSRKRINSNQGGEANIVWQATPTVICLLVTIRDRHIKQDQPVFGSLLHKMEGNLPLVLRHVRPNHRPFGIWFSKYRSNRVYRIILHKNRQRKKEHQRSVHLQYIIDKEIANHCWLTAVLAH